MLAALARGTSELRGLLTGADVKSTARVLRQLGAMISPIREGAPVRVARSPLTAPRSPLYCGNSGTTARLMVGILAGQRFAATLTGDASLRRRPMRRVTEPLRQMGAEITERGDGLPLTIRGGRLRGLTYQSPVASAQVKSAILFAGLTGNVPVTIHEPYRSRDHTERLFAHLGLGIHEREGAIVLEPPNRPAAIPPFHLSVPGDPSSAAFLVAAAVLAEEGELRVKESNRLELVAANLRAVGARAEARGNDLHVAGGDRPPRGRVETASDHRLAMAFAVLGTLPGSDVKLSEKKSVAISYPSFFRDLRTCFA